MGFILTDLGGLELTAEDKQVLAHPAVAGIILFSRNYHNLDQLKSLTSAIKAINSNIFIVADQEGGRVQRFRSQFTLLPSMREWSNRYQVNPVDTLDELKRVIATMASELKSMRVDASLVPVLDVDYGISDIISDRSFGPEISLINTLADAVIATLHANGMPCTGKHFPGHGAVKVDSHKDLPIDKRPFSHILHSDLAPYQAFVGRLDAIMPAHVIYPEVDAMPAGFSKVWLQSILRKKLGYQGVILSDDISMKAVVKFGDYPTRAQMALNAGCDIVSVCNNRKGLLEVLSKLGNYHSPESLARLSNFARKY